MTEHTQILMSMFLPIYAVGGWMIKMMFDIKGDTSDIKAEIRHINKRLDSLESGVIAKR